MHMYAMANESTWVFLEIFYLYIVENILKFH